MQIGSPRNLIEAIVAIWHIDNELHCHEQFAEASNEKVHVESSAQIDMSISESFGCLCAVSTYTTTSLQFLTSYKVCKSF